MGQSQSAPEHREVPIEQISHELALRFADKCYSHLEITHFKDNFKSRADHQDDVEYWKEETLCQFLSLPDSIRAGPVIYQMSTYLGSFPFPSLAPCILTREAMLKTITIMTGRYRKVLKRGDHDKHKLLFRSMAVFDRRMSSLSPTVEKKMADLTTDVNDDNPQTRARGFTIDEPLNDDEDEDDDDLALAALDALDAIEVFQHDQRKERKISQAHIPVENLQKLIMLILLYASITPLDSLEAIARLINAEKLKQLEGSADAMILAFHPESLARGIRYASFVKTITTTMPYLFRPLNPLFEHFMFSRNIDLSRHAAGGATKTVQNEEVRESPIFHGQGDASNALLNDVLLAQLSASIEIGTTSSPAASTFFHSGAKFNELYSTTSHGTSMSSFSRQILSWRSATLLLISGSTDTNEPILLGAYLPERWKETGEPVTGEILKTAAMFQLKPQHAIFRANIYNKTTPLSHFSTKTGISLGCIIPQQSRVQAQYQAPILGPVSLLIDQDMSTATFQHDPDAGSGAFLTDPRLEEYQHAETGNKQPKKVEFDIDTLEIWGVSFSDKGEDEIVNQKKRLAWEEAEAARRRGLNFGGDKDGARALLEMAGIVGDGANRSGGSV